MYAYAGALAPNGVTATELRDELATRYRQSVAAAVTTTVPRIGDEVHGELQMDQRYPPFHVRMPTARSLYHWIPISAWKSASRSQRFPRSYGGSGECGNLLAQGYVPIASSDGSVVFVPSYRYFRGGLSLQF